MSLKLKVKAKMDGKDAKKFLSQATVEPGKKFSDKAKVRLKIKQKD